MAVIEKDMEYMSLSQSLQSTLKKQRMSMAETRPRPMLIEEVDIASPTKDKERMSVRESSFERRDTVTNTLSQPKAPSKPSDEHFIRDTKLGW